MTSIAVALANRDCPEEEHEKDEIRQLADVLSFFGIQEGNVVADFMASRGYLAGALSAIVGTSGKVYAHNSQKLIDRFKGENPIPERAKEYGIDNLSPIVCELEEIELPEPLDMAFSIMFYHDTVWVGTDRPAMNKGIFNALKPGGIFAVIDHHTETGKGDTVAEELHRVERDLVVKEVTDAGFVLEEESDLLENPDDPLTAMIFDKSIRNKSSKFMLKFRKPN